MTVQRDRRRGHPPPGYSPPHGSGSRRPQRHRQARPCPTAPGRASLRPSTHPSPSPEPGRGLHECSPGARPGRRRRHGARRGRGRRSHRGAPAAGAAGPTGTSLTRSDPHACLAWSIQPRFSMALMSAQSRASMQPRILSSWHQRMKAGRWYSTLVRVMNSRAAILGSRLEPAESRTASAMTLTLPQLELLVLVCSVS